MIRDILYLSVFAALIPAILYRPWFGVIAWTLLGLVNPQVYTWGLHNFQFAMWVGGATLLGILYTRARRGVPLTAQTVLLSMLALWFTITSLTAWSPAAAWEQWEKVMKIFLMTFVTMILIYDKLRLHVLLLVITLSIALFGVKGGLFVIASGGHHMVMGPGEGTYIGGNNNFGLALAMIIPMLLVVAREQKRLWARNAAWAAFWLSVIAAIFTYSRGALLGVAAVLFFLFFGVKRKVLVLMLVIPAFLVALPFAPEALVSRASTIETYQSDNSAMGRIQAWGVALNIAAAHPFGAGFGLDFADRDTWLSYATFMLDTQPRVISAHSIYFQMLGEHGFIGLFLFLALLVSTWRALGRVRIAAAGSKDSSWMADWAAAMRIGLVGYMVAGAFLSLAYFDLLFTWAAIAVIMQRECGLAPSIRGNVPAAQRTMAAGSPHAST